MRNIWHSALKQIHDTGMQSNLKTNSVKEIF